MAGEDGQEQRGDLAVPGEEVEKEEVEEVGMEMDMEMEEVEMVEMEMDVEMEERSI